MATVGRPPKYETQEELHHAADGLISYAGRNISNSDFIKEKDLSSYIEKNIVIFCKNNLNDSYISHKVDMPVIPMTGFGPRTRRVDLYVKCSNHTYIVELKNPTNLMENRQGIGQLLDYGRELSQNNARLLLITTKFDINTAKTISHYRLPISYLYLSKNIILEYKGDH